MSRESKLNRLSLIYKKHQVYEAIFSLTEIDELIFTLLAIKHEFENSDKDFAVLGFLTEPNVASSVSAHIKCGRILVFVGWDLIQREDDNSKNYQVADLQKRLVDFSEDLRLI